MTRNPDKILSASRRTDIPAFYMDWFMKQINLGFFDIKNPYTKAVKSLNLSENKIHTIVFWSKNYHTFIKSKAGEKLQKLGFNLYFNFTINSRSSFLEAALPPVKERLDQLAEIAQAFGPKTISWRFDPICFYRESTGGPVRNNLDDFKMISKTVGELGVEKCITSFCDPYPKIKKRLRFLCGKQIPDMEFITPPMEKKHNILQRMEKQLHRNNIQLFACCEKEILEQLGPDSSIRENACIDGKLLKKLFGGNPETRRDYGQRSKLGCRCTRSIDVGAYEDHPCFHNCLFCYANPEIDTRIPTGNRTKQAKPDRNQIKTGKIQ